MIIKAQPGTLFPDPKEQGRRLQANTQAQIQQYDEWSAMTPEQQQQARNTRAQAYIADGPNPVNLVKAGLSYFGYYDPRDPRAPMQGTPPDISGPGKRAVKKAGEIAVSGAKKAVSKVKQVADDAVEGLTKSQKRQRNQQVFRERQRIEDATYGQGGRRRQYKTKVDKAYANNNLVHLNPGRPKNVPQETIDDLARVYGDFRATYEPLLKKYVKLKAKNKDPEAIHAAWKRIQEYARQFAESHGYHYRRGGKLNINGVNINKPYKLI